MGIMGRAQATNFSDGTGAVLPMVVRTWEGLASFVEISTLHENGQVAQPSRRTTFSHHIHEVRAK